MISPFGLAAWGAGFLVAAAAGIGFLRRTRPPALRSRSAARVATGVLAARLLLLVLDFRLGGPGELLLYTAFLLVAAAGIIPGEVWLLRCPPAEVAAKLEAGSRALLVTLSWPARGRFTFTSRGIEYRGALRGLGGRFSILWLPPPGDKGKARLMVNWLAKQYPGPFPRPRIALKRRQP